jgi:ribosome-associated toxin RatA of RatAB toxin-antitoxin module
MKRKGIVRLLAALLSVALLAIWGRQADAASSPHIVRYAVPVAGSKLPAGAARGGVGASTAVIGSVVTDYEGYDVFISRFKSAKVVKRGKNSTDVYLEVPILHGLSKVWAVTRFEHHQAADGSSVVRGRMLKGNMKRFDTTWRVRKLRDGSSELALELLVVPDFYAPDWLVLQEVKAAAARGVGAALKESLRRSRARSR